MRRAGPAGSTVPDGVAGEHAPAPGSPGRTDGRHGRDVALAGLMLGWGAVILGIILVAAALVIAAGTHGAMPMH